MEEIIEGRQVGAAIMSRATYLQWVAEVKHKAWFKAPASGQARRDYAYALKAWAAEVKNARALAHAEALLKGDAA